MRAMGKGGTFQVIHPDDPPDEQTVWHIRQLTTSECQSLERMNRFEQLTAALRLGICGIDGLLDDEGNPLGYETQQHRVGNRTVEGVHDDLLLRVPRHVLDWLSAQIITGQRLQDDERKK